MKKLYLVLALSLLFVSCGINNKNDKLECKNIVYKIYRCVEKKYHDNGNLESETPYKNFKKEGVKQWYHENGSLTASITFENDKAISAQCQNGKMIPSNLFDANQITLVYFCAENNNIKECQNEQDKISGCVEKKYHDNGNLESETPYKNGKKDGIEKGYYANGYLQYEIPYKNGKLEGNSKAYRINGNLRYNTPYINGRIDGVSKSYHENGNLGYETPYKDGKEEGSEKYYDENGKLAFFTIYKNGHIINSQCENGKNIPANNVGNRTDEAIIDYCNNKREL